MQFPSNLNLMRCIMELYSANTWLDAVEWVNFAEIFKVIIGVTYSYDEARQIANHP